MSQRAAIQDELLSLAFHKKAVFLWLLLHSVLVSKPIAYLDFPWAIPCTFFSMPGARLNNHPSHNLVTCGERIQKKAVSLPFEDLLRLPPSIRHNNSLTLCSCGIIFDVNECLRWRDPEFTED